MSTWFKRSGNGRAANPRRTGLASRSSSRAEHDPALGSLRTLRLVRALRLRPQVGVVVLLGVVVALAAVGVTAGLVRTSSAKAAGPSTSSASGLTAGPASCPGAAYYPYSLGPSNAGLPLTSSTVICNQTPPEIGPPVPYSESNYGTCLAVSGSSCSLPLTIQSWPECKRNYAMYGSTPPGQFVTVSSLSGLPAAAFYGGTMLELYTGTTTVVVFGQGTSDVMAAASALVPQMVPRMAASLFGSAAPVGPSAVSQATALIEQPATAALLHADALGTGCSGSAAATAATATPTPQSMDLKAPYTYNDPCTDNWVDPINVVWSKFSTNPHYNTVTNLLENWAGLTINDYNYVTVDHQDTKHVNGSCSRDLAQRANDCIACNRDHIRVMFANSTYLVGDAHHDVNTFDFDTPNNDGCGEFGVGHASSTFDGPENSLVTAWRTHGGTASYGWWGNTSPRPQCDDTMVHGSGYPAFLTP